MSVANIAPASAPEFQSYDRHECLYKFLMMKPFSAADFKKEMKLFPKDGRFFNSLCYMGVYKNTGITDFSAWLAECTTAVKSIASACGRILRSDAERGKVCRMADDAAASRLEHLPREERLVHYGFVVHQADVVETALVRQLKCAGSELRVEYVCPVGDDHPLGIDVGRLSHDAQIIAEIFREGKGKT